MAQHFRDFLDPQLDAGVMEMLHPQPGLAQDALTRLGAGALRLMGGRHTWSTVEAEEWQVGRGEHTAVIDIHEPETVLPAWLRHGDRGAFYTYTAEDKPLWTPNRKLTVVPPEIDTGNAESDRLVVAGQALYDMATFPRQMGNLGAWAVSPLRDTWSRLTWKPSTAQTKAEIAAHYDLTQSVYTGEHGFLDDEYVQYSSGYLPDDVPFTSLHDMQARKIASLAEMLQLDTAKTLLEVGGGWGGLAVALATSYPDLHITSLTVSAEQYERACQRAEAAGVGDRVKFLQQDYRDLKPDKPFDRIVSVEMIEAVAWQDLGVYFDTLDALADPKTGVVTLQSINIPGFQAARQRHNKSFANTAIFPGGSLGTVIAICKHMRRRGFFLVASVELTDSYPPTLREWRRNLNANEPALTEQWLRQGIPADKIARFYRAFNLYLAWSETGFRTRNIQDWQLSFSRQPL